MNKHKNYYENVIDKYKDIKSSKYPYLTVFLDLKKDAVNYKRVKIFVKDLFKDIKEGKYEFKSELTKKELNRFLEKYESELLKWIEDNYKHSKTGAIVILGGDNEEFNVIEISHSVPFQYFVKDKPEIWFLTSLLEKEEPTLVLFVDSRGTKVYTSVLGELEKREDIENESWPLIDMKKRVDTSDKDLLHGVYVRYVKELINKIKELQNKNKFGRILIYTNPKLEALFREELPDGLKDIVFVFNRSLNNSNIVTISDYVLHDILEVEKIQDKKELENALNKIGVSDLKEAVGGIDDVIKYLNAKAIYKLFIDYDFDFPKLYKDEATNMLALSKNDLSFSENISEVEDVVNELVLTAFNQGAKINFVENSDELKNVGGVLGLTRFKI